LTEKKSSYTIAAVYNSFFQRHGDEVTMSNLDNSNEEKNFVEFRRKVRATEVLSAAVERLLLSLHFTGRVTVVVQNGRVLKSGYEEGYFRRRAEASGAEN
jgi:hypothetical protein